MKTLVIGSMRSSAGKTSIIAGLARASGRTCGYMKPFGDRLLYKKKRLWDYDAALMTRLLGLEQDPESITLGFEHAKLKYTYTKDTARAKLQELQGSAEASGAELLLVEGGKDLAHGMSLELDSISLARHLSAGLLLIVHGDEGAMVDDVEFLRRYVDMAGVELLGLVFNQVQDPEEFESVYHAQVEAAGLPILGVVPRRKELCTMTVGMLAEIFFAKVVAGQENLSRPIGEVLVGAMSVDSVLRQPAFHHEDKLLITSGDRSDMILAALESGASGIIITNNILPPGHIIARAAEAGIPLLQVAAHTYQVAKQIDDYDALLTHDDQTKIELVESLVKEHLDLGRLL